MERKTESVTLQSITKAFFDSQKKADVTAVDGVTLHMPSGQFTTLLGPSGCGKTTILRMIAGFETPTSGLIRIGDRNVNDLPPQARDTAMVFQSYAIFPHLSVFENIAYGLRIKKMTGTAIKERVDWALALMRMEQYADRQPRQLSGGQQQRVALARALVMEPKVLLFDEPLSNLDAKLRVHMRDEIRKIQQRLGITTVYVTHDQIEAMSMSDQIVVINGGRVEQVGSPEEIYRRPASRFVADFVGKANFLPAFVPAASETSTVMVLDQPLAAGAENLPVGMPLTAIVRPEHIRLGEGPWTAEVKRTVYLGSHVEYTLAAAEHELTAIDFIVNHRLVEGAKVKFSLMPEYLHFIADR